MIKPFKRVLDYFKEEDKNIKIVITRKPPKEQDAQFGGIKYNVNVGNTKFEFTAYDGSTDTENILIRSIGYYIDKGQYAKGGGVGDDKGYGKLSSEEIQRRVKELTSKGLSYSQAYALVVASNDNKMKTGGGVGELKWITRGNMYLANGKNKYDIVKGANSYTLYVNGKVKSHGGLSVMKAYALDLEKDKMAKGGYVFKGDKYEYVPTKFIYTIGGL